MTFLWEKNAWRKKIHEKKKQEVKCYVKQLKADIFQDKSDKNSNIHVFWVKWCTVSIFLFCAKISAFKNVKNLNRLHLSFSLRLISWIKKPYSRKVMCSSYIVDIFTFALFCTTLALHIRMNDRWNTTNMRFFSLFFLQRSKISSHSCVYQLTSIVHTVYILKPVGSMKLYCACNIFNANKKNTFFSHLVRLNGLAGMRSCISHTWVDST